MKNYNWLLFLLGLLQATAFAQVSVLSGHNDIARTGANTQETILTPASVVSGNFEKLLSIQLTAPQSEIAAQPLYVPGIQIGGATHNVVIAATTANDVFALDADNGLLLWQITLLDAAHGAAPDAINDPDLRTACEVSENAVVIGITGTPAIDSSTGTIYLVGRTWENNYAVERIHALDITSGEEKFGGPTAIQATVPGTGWESVAGQVSFDPEVQFQRTGLLLLNGVVYVAFAANCEGDFGGWHGWVMGYNAATMSQTGAWVTTPNAKGSGIWMSGAALAADVLDPVNQPFGRMFVATGNGVFDAVPPYTTFSDFGDDIVRLDLTNGLITPQDSFTEDDQYYLGTTDGDLGSGAVTILPDSVGSVAHPHLLVEGSKAGNIFLVDRDNMGGYSSSTDAIVQELDGALSGGLFASPAFWNGSLYFWGAKGPLEAFSMASGVMSSAPTSVSTGTPPGYPGATPSISANGETNGIVWALTGAETKQAALQAFDATNVGTLLYSSATNLARDNPGNRTKFSVPTVVNGKVYVGSYVEPGPGPGALGVYGSMFTVSAQSAAVPAAPNSSPTITLNVASPFGSSFTGAVTLSVTGLPAGVTANFSTSSVTLGQSPATGTSVLTLTIPGSLALEDYSFQVTGSSGGLQSLAALTLDVSDLAQVTVPNVVGDTQASATTAITGASLALGTVTSATSSTFSAGTVISQSPVGGTSSYASFPVTLVISVGPPITVPNVVGDTQSAATSAITSAGLVSGIVSTTASSTIAAGKVISESPVAGTSSYAGSAVNLVVSLGAPTVVSLSPSSGTGLTQTFTGVYSDPTGLWDLTYVYLLFNTTLSGNGACYLNYNPATNLVSLYNNAGTAVLSPGVTPGSSTSVSNSQCTLNGTGSSVSTSGNNLTLNVALTFSGTVLTQENVYMSARGNSLNSGWVKEGTWTPVAAPITVPSVVGDTQAVATTAITSAGLVLGTVTTAASTMPAGNVISESPAAGTSVNAGSAVNLVISGGPPTVVSLSPSSGTGITQTFTGVYSDPGGTSDLNYVYVLFNTSLTGNGACYVSYNPGANLMYLYNNAGTAVLSPAVAPGSSTSVSNSQCTLNGTGSSFGTSGNNLTLNVALTFSGTSTEAENAYMEAQGKTTNSGWVKEGTWTPVAPITVPNVVGDTQAVATTAITSAGLVLGTVTTAASTMPAGNVISESPAAGTSVNAGSAVNLVISGGPPTVVSLSPSSGTGITQTFTGVYSDPGGTSDLNYVYVLFNTSLTGNGACYVSYKPGTNLMYLYNNAGTAVLSPAVAPGSSTSVSNSQCTLNGTGSSFGTSGNNLTLNVALTFSGTSTEAENAYMEAQGKTTNSGWVKEGTWTPVAPITVPNVVGDTQAVATTAITSAGLVLGTVTTAASTMPAGNVISESPAAGTSVNAGSAVNLVISGGPPTVVSLSPSSGTGITQTFTGVYSDPGGTSDLNYVYVLFNTSLTGNGACYVSYKPGTNLMYLYNNAGTAVLSPAVAPGSSTSVSNSQCTLNGTGSSFGTSGNNLTLNVALTFSGTSTGAENAYMEAQGKTTNSGWVKEGTWTP